MVDTVSLAAFATQMSNQNTGNQVDMAVLQKSQSIANMQGAEALQLLQASTINPNIVTPTSVDVHA